MDTQTAVLVSIFKVWISAPDTQTPKFLGFLGVHTADFGFFYRETKIFNYFPEVPVTKFVGSQHQLRIKTLPSSDLLEWIWGEVQQ